jgi:thiol-disulfide isomerase/thioredoxin
MTRSRLTLCVLGLLLAGPHLQAAENLNLNPDLNYKKNGWQGPLITGDKIGEGLVPDQPNYIIFYAGFCYNAKRQARRTVHLYEKYRDRVHFVTVDLSKRKSLTAEQEDLRKKFFRDSIPQTVIIDRTGKVVFDYTGEAEESTLMGWLDSTLR